MARLPIPGSDQGSWGQVLNNYLSQAHQADGTLKADSVTSSHIVDGAVTESKLSTDVQTKLNATGNGNGNGNGVSSVNGRGGAVTLAKADVGLSNVDNSSDMNKPVSNAVSAALNSKADATHSHGIADVTGLQAALDGKVNNGSFTLDALTDVSSSSATDGQTLIFNGGLWGPGTLGSNGTVTDATTTAKGVVQLAGDLSGTATAPTVPGLASKASNAITITGANSLTGGGNLTTSRTISLAGDVATPGNNQYYGTNGSGAKGYYALPSASGGGDPTLGGDLTGTASNAQIAANAVGTAEIAANTITTAKLADSAVSKTKLNATGGTNGQVLTTDGTGLSWTTPSTGGGDPTLGGDLTGTASNAQIAANAVGTAEIAANAVGSAALATNAVTTAKLADSAVSKTKLNATGGTNGQVLTTDGTGLSWTTPSTGGGQSYTFRNITANTTAANNDFIFITDVSSGAVTITLPNVSAGGYVRIKRLAAAGNSVQVVAPNGAYIDGPSVGSHTINDQYQSNDFVSNGTNWYRV